MMAVAASGTDDARWRAVELGVEAADGGRSGADIPGPVVEPRPDDPRPVDRKGKMCPARIESSGQGRSHARRMGWHPSGEVPVPVLVGERSGARRTLVRGGSRDQGFSPFPVADRTVSSHFRSLKGHRGGVTEPDRVRTRKMSSKLYAIM